MKIAIAQINVVVGDLAGNVERIVAAAKQAAQQGACLVLTPELALCGYCPEDWLLRPSFLHDCQQHLHTLAERTAALGLGVIAGFPANMADGRRYNAAALLADGRIQALYHKHFLPNYLVFDEERYFSAGTQECVFDWGGVRFGLNICADIWYGEAAPKAAAAGAEVLLILNASPFHLDKQAERHHALRTRARQTGMAMVYANLVGGQDEVVFDGASFAMDRSGQLQAQAATFVEELLLIEIEKGEVKPGHIAPSLPTVATAYDALVLGVRDYIGKNGFPGVLLGLSGGIDSAVVLAVVVDALGADRVHAVMMPSRYTAQISLDDARWMAEAHQVRYSELPIDDLVQSYDAALADQFAGLPIDTTEENLQSRIRGNLLMALSNKSGKLVVTTGNKSEMAVGYATLYGDMAGGFAVLKDADKALVYAMADERNRRGRVIPQRVIERPPSAELRPDQTDQDSLPPYAVLDEVLRRFIECDQSRDEIVQAGFDPAMVDRIVQMTLRAEYKRRQSPVGVRLTARGFGKDWRYPITSRYRG